MSQLTREKAGGFTLAQTHSLEEIAAQMATAGNIDAWLMPLDTPLAEYPHVALTDAQWAFVKDGVGLSGDKIEGQPARIVLTYQGEVKSVFDWHVDKQLYRPYRTFSIE
jgi:tRNA pseudouridine55 synthase